MATTLKNSFCDSANTTSEARTRIFRTIGRPWLLLCLTLVALAAPVSAWAQQFAPIPALSFSSTYGGGNPLPQMLTVNSTGTAIDFSVTATTNSGGSWLSISPASFGCCGANTPYPFQVIANPAGTLAAGTYTGQVVVTPSSTSVTPLTIPVTLVVHLSTAAYFDQIAGGLTFSLLTGGDVPPAQELQVRNAGAGSLAWTASVSTADGGGWLSLSSTSGTAPTNLSASISLSKLPGLGLTTGTFEGQIVFKSASDSMTVPVRVTVGASVFRQINPLNFVKTYAGANPLSQVITAASTGTQFAAVASIQNSTGGSWLTLTPSSFGCCGINTPTNITVGVNPAVTLAAGTYMAEVVVSSADGTQNVVVPVTMTVNPTSAAYFDDVAGALNFSMETTGEAPPAQSIQIRNAGTGTLAWNSTAVTADGGNWLTVAAASGTAPTDTTVSVNKANLPGGGLVAGTFVGQVALQSAGSRLTIPVSYTVGASAFRQVNPLGFVKVFGGSNPLPQIITVASTGTNFAFNAVTINSTGGSWLTITPSSFGCCGVNTPQGITVGVNPAVTLAVGTYSAEVVVESEDTTQSMTIPVTLTVEAATSTFFDDLPGQMTFSMLTKGNPPPAQVLPIRNAGEGTLDWTATTSTSDGGAWLSISAASGTAPANPTVSVNPTNLPGGGLVAGTFTGTIILAENGNQITVPVSMVVGASVFNQINPLAFTMTVGGANPLPQVITAASTGANFAFFASAVNSTGGNWLSITPSSFGCCGINTPEAIVATVTTAATLTAGTYSAQIIIRSSDGTLSQTVPVTLTVEPKTAAYFDELPGQLAFSMVNSGTAPPTQPIEIRNAGAGSLAWTASLSTSDGGAWLAISATSGTAPTVPQVSIVPSKLPGGGVTSGTFTGQVILETPTDRVTIPVLVTVGPAVFRQVNAVDFNMTFGGAAPLPQVVNITSNGTAFPFFGTAVNGTGGNWLSISPSSFGCCGVNSPQQLILTVTPSATLAAGTYTSEVILTASAGSPSMVIPVTLTVNAATTTYFDDMPGGVSFFQATNGPNPAAQAIPIRNAGTGTLDWTATASTSDGGAWLTIGAASGTAPSSLSVSIKSANLPGKGIVAGIFNGQIVLKTGLVRETIPVQVVVGANVFEPIAPLSFSKAYNGANPTYQVINVASTSANFAFLGLKATANGGNWLTISPSSFGCCGINTPQSVQVSVNPATTLAAGSYVGEIIFTTSAGDQGMVVPVTLTVNGTAAAAAPTFTPPAGTYTAAQNVTILDATRGSAIYYTTDGTTPTTASKVYSAPIAVTATETIKAIATAPGYNQSAVAAALYTLQGIEPEPYPSAISVAVTDADASATIYYTTNGSTPTASSTKYTGPIPFTTSTTLKYIAIKAGNTNSPVRTVIVTVE